MDEIEGLVAIEEIKQVKAHDLCGYDLYHVQEYLLNGASSFVIGFGQDHARYVKRPPCPAHISYGQAGSGRRALFAHRAGARTIGANRHVRHYGVPDQQSDRATERLAAHNGPVLSMPDVTARQRVAA